MKISIVSPVYKAENIVEQLVKEIQDNMQHLDVDYEIILVEDGSPDHSWQKIEQICSQEHTVIGLKLSRNFGQHYAITAGLDKAKGEWIVVMDCDLQDRPDEIPNLYHKALEGYDLVFAQRTLRNDGFLKKLSSRIFYAIFSYMTDTKQDSSIANFGIYHSRCIKAMLSMNDHIRFFPTMSRWTGFNQTKLPVKHAERADGASSYSFRRLLKLAFNNMIAFSDKPLWIMVKFGAIISFLSVLAGFIYLYQYFNGVITEPGFTTLTVSIWFLSGTIILMLGIVGIYVGKTFESTKERPLYIIDKSINYE